MFPRIFALFILALSTSLTAFADFSYTTTTKTTGGSMAAMAGTAGDRTGKYYFKGDKMMMTSGDTATIIDFGAQTVTTINNAQKTYSVKKFSDVAGAAAGMNMDVSMDVKDTGNKKTVNGFNASEMVVTMSMDMDAGRGGAPMKMQMEMHMWISPDVPGAGEVRVFYRKNAANFPWAAMMGNGGNPSMQKAMAQMQRKMAEMDGMVVEDVVRIMPAGGAQGQASTMPQMPQMTAEQQAQMQAAMAKMQQMQQQGGQNAQSAAAMQQAMAAMGAMGRGPAAGNSAGGAMIETTIDSTGFSSAGVPDSVFAIPAGYQAK